MFLAKWTILAQVWPKIMQACITGSAVSIFLNFAGEKYTMAKYHLREISKKNLFLG